MMPDGFEYSEQHRNEPEPPQIENPDKEEWDRQAAHFDRLIEEAGCLQYIDRFKQLAANSRPFEKVPPSTLEEMNLRLASMSNRDRHDMIVEKLEKAEQKQVTEEE